MSRRDLLLAALSPANGGPYTPVQVQKLLFLIDREIADQINGPHFSFEPYDHGPFDKAVYREFDALKEEGFLRTYTEYTRRFQLTEAEPCKNGS